MVIILSDSCRLALRVGLFNVTQPADAGHTRCSIAAGGNKRYLSDKIRNWVQYNTIRVQYNTCTIIIITTELRAEIRPLEGSNARCAGCI
jgi:hypothetical protein